MKTILNVYVGLMLVILVSSCGSHAGFMKRKYRKGHYHEFVKAPKLPNGISASSEGVKHSANLEPKAIPNARVVQQSSSERSLANTPSTLVESVGAPSSPTKNLAPYFTSKNETKRKTNAADKAVAAAEFKPALHQTSAAFKALLAQQSNKGNSDVNAVLLVVCCIFLPPLAVYLFQDDVTVDFWIDLVLCLLFWIPAVVFAFLVCFANVSFN